jgi:allose kinase
VETYVGGKFLDAVRREKYPETPIGELFKKHGVDVSLGSYVRHLAAVIASEINIIDPESVILGGGVLSMNAFPYDTLVESIRSYVRKPLPEGNLRFIYSESAPENGVIGAGAYAWSNLRLNEKGTK